MNLIDKDNLVYLNEKPKLKFAIYGAVIGFLMLVFLGLSLVLSAYRLGTKAEENGVDLFSLKPPVDASHRYIEAYYFAKGIDQFDVMAGEVPPTPYKLTGGIVPNGILMHVLLTPPFFSPSISISIYLFFLIGCVGFSSFIIYKYASNRMGVFLGAISVLAFVAQKEMLVTLSICNYAPFVFLVIIGLSFTNFFEKHPVLGGFIMGLAMVKAQMMVLMFLPFLMQKRFLSIGVSVATVIVSLLIVAWQLDKSPILLMQEYFELGNSKMFSYNANTSYFGLFVNSALELGIDSKYFTILSKLSLVFFFVVSAVFSYVYRAENKIFLYSFLAVISSLWGYNYTVTTMPICYILLVVPTLYLFAKREKVDTSFALIAIPFLLIATIRIPRTVLFAGGGASLNYQLFAFQDTLLRLFVLFYCVYLFYIYRKNNLMKPLNVK